MAQNLVTEYQSKLDQIFTFKSQIDKKYGNNGYSWVDAETISIKSLLTVDIQDYNAATGYDPLTKEDVQDIQTLYKISQNKFVKQDFDIDYIKDNKQGASLVQQWIKAETGEKIIPQHNRHFFNVMFDAVGKPANTTTTVDGGQKTSIIAGLPPVTYVDTVDSAYGKLREAIALFQEENQETTEFDAYITPTFASKVDTERGVVSSTEYDDQKKARAYQTINGIKFQMIPSNLFPANVQAIFVNRSAVVAPVKYESIKIFRDGENQFYDGTRIIFHYRYDAFVLGNKTNGVVAVVE